MEIQMAFKSASITEIEASLPDGMLSAKDDQQREIGRRSDGWPRGENARCKPPRNDNFHSTLACSHGARGHLGNDRRLAGKCWGAITMKRLTMVLGAFMIFASTVQADDYGHGRHRGSRNHARYHDELEHREYHRELIHRDAHRYPMSHWEHRELHRDLDHSRYHDHLDHARAHRSGAFYGHRPRHSTYYRGGYGGGYGGGYYAVPGYYGGSGFSYSTPGFSIWIGGR